MIHCLLIDDDEMSRKCLEELLKKARGWRLIASCCDVMEAREYLNKNTVDVLFLDVEMPEITGIEFLKTLDEKPEIVIVSAQEKYALDAIEHEIIDYLVKPVNPDRFLKTITRIENKLADKRKDLLSENSVFVKVNGQAVKILLQDILWVEAYGDYVSIYTLADRFVVHTTMKTIEGKLPGDQFVRVHRSFIVRLDKINAIEDTLIIIRKKLIPIGDMYRDDLMSHLKFL